MYEGSGKLMSEPSFYCVITLLNFLGSGEGECKLKTA